MIRSSSVLRRTVPAVGALVAAVVLSACGVSHPGAAAVVGQDKITVSAVQARMAAVRSEGAAQSSGQPAASYQEPADLAQATVAQMVMSAVVAHALATNGLSVSDTEIARTRQAEAQELGGEPALEQMLLVKQAVPTGQIDAFYREWLGLQKLAGLSGQQIGSPQAATAVRQLLAQSATDLKVSVNPRYGSWDDQQGVLNGPSAAWLPPAAPAA